MIGDPKLSHKELRKILIEASKECPSDKSVAELVKIAYRISASYLNVKIYNRKLNPNFFGISPDDLAIDCIAELFQRDEKGVLTEFQYKFSDIINTEPLE